MKRFLPNNKIKKQIIKLSEQEEKLRSQILLFSKGDVVALDNFIKQSSDEDILKIAINDEQVDKICKSEQLTSYWQKLWCQCGLNSSKHKYEPLLTVSCFDLLKGLYVYEQYRNYIDTNNPEVDRAAQFLHLSASYGCFFSINALCVKGLTLLKEWPTEELAAYILLQAQKAAELYWTPGYLLLGNVLHELTNHVDLLPMEDKKSLYKKALQALHTAQLLESYSSAMVINAYQGKTLKDASKGFFKSWFQIKLDLISRSGGLISNLEVITVYDSARLEANLIFKKYGLQNQDLSARCIM